MKKSFQQLNSNRQHFAPVDRISTYLIWLNHCHTITPALLKKLTKRSASFMRQLSLFFGIIQKTLKKQLHQWRTDASRCEAGPPDQSSRKLRNKCQLARPLTMRNSVILQQKVSQISEKVDHSSTKSIKISYALIPLTLPNLVGALPKNVPDTEK